MSGFQKAQHDDYTNPTFNPPTKVNQACRFDSVCVCWIIAEFSYGLLDSAKYLLEFVGLFLRCVLCSLDLSRDVSWLAYSFASTYGPILPR